MGKPRYTHKLESGYGPPRVPSTYDVESAMPSKNSKDCLSVVGGPWRLSPGCRAKPRPKLKERRFVEVTPSNFDAVLEIMRASPGFPPWNNSSATTRRWPAQGGPEVSEFGNLSQSKWRGRLSLCVSLLD